MIKTGSRRTSEPYCWLLPGEFICPPMSVLCWHEEFGPSHTLYWMSLSSLSLCDEFFLLLFPSLKFLYPLIVVINSNTQDLLCPILTDDKLVEMLLEHFWGQSGRAIRRCASQWTGRGQTRFIGAGEWLVHKVRSMKLRGRGRRGGCGGERASRKCDVR
jgi:hypothetical protein